KVRPDLRCVLYDQTARLRHGPGNQPLHCGVSWWPPLGPFECRPRRDVCLHASPGDRPPRIMAEHGSMVFVIDDDPSIRLSIQGLLKSVGLRSESFGSAQDFLSHGAADGPSCLILDVRLPGMS